MEKQDILNILESLDLQISMGKIDLTTYNQLKKKWQDQLQRQENGSTSAPVTGPVGVSLTPSTPLAPLPSYNTTSPLGPTTGPIQRPLAEALVCPKCGAPADINPATQDLSKPLKCLYCDTVYMLRQGQDNLQSIKQDIKSWLDQMIVGSGFSDGKSIDVNARRFIFTEYLYPALRKDMDYHLEAFDGLIEAPLVQLKETLDFPDYRPSPRLLAIARGENKWLMSLSGRVSAPQLQDFAVVPEDKTRLNQHRLHITSLIYYANIAQQLTAGSPGSLQIVRQNLVALQKNYDEFSQDISDANYRSYISALKARINANILLLNLLIGAFGNNSIDAKIVLDRLDQIIAELQKVYKQAFDCAYNPLYTVPLQQGIYKDIICAQLFQAAVKCYQVVNDARPQQFVPFYVNLVNYVRMLARVESADHLLWLLRSVGRVMMARAGVSPLPAVLDWQWMQNAFEGNRYKSTFGLSSETGEIKEQHFHPYWVARLNYSEVGGTFGKKGVTREGLILVDATSPVVSTAAPAPVALLLGNDPLLPVIQAGTNNFNFLDKQKASLPALLTHDMAERAMKAYANQHQNELKVPIVRMIGVIYLPAATFEYSSKNRTRELVAAPVQAINQDVNNMLEKTQQFLKQYGV